MQTADVIPQSALQIDDDCHPGFAGGQRLPDSPTPNLAPDGGCLPQPHHPH
jgi:hypothetical protein